MVIHLWNWDRKRRLIRFTSYTVTFGQYLMYPSLFIWRAYLDCVIWLVIHLTSQITQSKYANMWWFFFCGDFWCTSSWQTNTVNSCESESSISGFCFHTPLLSPILVIFLTISHFTHILDNLPFYSYSRQPPIVFIFSTIFNIILLLTNFCQYYCCCDYDC